MNTKQNIQKHCKYGHTLPTDIQVCDDQSCDDFYPDDRMECINLKPSPSPQMMICEHSKECDHMLHLLGGDTICSHWDKHDDCLTCGGMCEKDYGYWKCIPYRR